MKKINKTYVFLLAVLFAFTPLFVVGCGDSQSMKLSSCGIIHEEEFGGVYIKSKIEDFNSLGFKYGDSVNITFSNGFKMNDIPYYNGYYTKTGEALLIAYPGYDYIKAAINNGEDLWDVADLTPSEKQLLFQEKNLLWNEANLTENMTATITLFQRGKYLDIQQARDIHYYDERELYPSNEIFANFRSLKGGKLKENLLFRSASPCDNQHNRAAFVDALMEENGIEYIIDLADTNEKIAGYIDKDNELHPDDEDKVISQYFKNLYSNGNICALALNMNFESDYFKQQVVEALTNIACHCGKTLIHCTEGKDRTGFVCMLIEALAGATYNEIVEDYMLTYFNYYAITKAFDENRHTTIVENVLNPMIEILLGGESADIKTANLSEYASEYLLTNGMTQVEIDTLKNTICNL